MSFQTVTYAAARLDFSLPLEGRATESGSGSAPISDSTSNYDSRPDTHNVSEGLAAFLCRLAAYFQGYLNSLGAVPIPCGTHSVQAPLSVIDTALDDTDGPLIGVRMNRALSRRMRWLIKRGRVERSGELRAATVDDEARCNLSPTQFIEYGIRVHGHSRVRAYGFGPSRRVLRLRAVLSAALQGDVVNIRQSALCAAPLTPD